VDRVTAAREFVRDGGLDRSPDVSSPAESMLPEALDEALDRLGELAPLSA
jgi:hypothetical protein